MAQQDSPQRVLSKTEESYLNKGDKSYYYWHPTVSNKVKVESPPLLERKHMEIAAQPTVHKITNYSWMDDEGLIKYHTTILDSCC